MDRPHRLRTRLPFARTAFVIALAAFAATAAPAQSLTPQARNAPVTIVVFAAFSCPYCERSARALAALAEKYRGRLAIQFKHYPLATDDAGLLRHEAALAAAAQGRFPSMHDALFAAPEPFSRADASRLARSMGLDMPRFEHDLDTHTWRERIDDDRREASGFGVRATPTVFVEGYKLEGAQDAAVFETLIEHALAKQPARSVPNGSIPENRP